jgi:hypothetical protein
MLKNTFNTDEHSGLSNCKERIFDGAQSIVFAAYSIQNVSVLIKEI